MGNFIIRLFAIAALIGLASLMAVDAEIDPAQIELPSFSNQGKYWPQNARFLVIVHQYDGDVSWASRLKFPCIIYEKNKPEKEPFNAINKAKGETNLLKFIAQFYDDLPENVIQVYQYEYKHYHEGSLVGLLNSPDFEVKYAQSKTPGFWNFNTALMGDVSPQIPRMMDSGWWPNTMAPWFGNIEDYGNFTQGKRACAQFVVSRERIRSLPREFYANMYRWLAANTLGEINSGYDPVTKARNPTPLDYHCNSNYFTSRYLEWSWELIFTSYKPREPIGLPYLCSTTPCQSGVLAALYGAKKYYRDVTREVIYHFLRHGKIIIPAGADFNALFSDPVYGSEKTLKLIIDGDKYTIPEVREKDIVINLTED
jgi:hypothetical protein